ALGPKAYDMSELWLLQRSMRSHVGKVLREDSDEPIELAKDLGILSPGYALTQFGNMIKLFVLERIGDSQEPSAQQNPLGIYDDVSLRFLYLYALFAPDFVFPAMLYTLSQGGSPDSALGRALDQIVAGIEKSLRLDELNDARGLFELRERIQK